MISGTREKNSFDGEINADHEIGFLETRTRSRDQLREISILLAGYRSERTGEQTTKSIRVNQRGRVPLSFSRMTLGSSRRRAKLFYARKIVTKFRPRIAAALWQRHQVRKTGSFEQRTVVHCRSSGIPGCRW